MEITLNIKEILVYLLKTQKIVNKLVFTIWIEVKRKNKIRKL